MVPVDIELRENNVIIAGRAKQLAVTLFKSKRAVFGIAVLAFFLILAVFGKFIAPYNPLIQSGPLWSPPSESHLFGTNYLGQDVFSWFVIGTATSLWVGVSVAFFSGLIGVSVGLTAGYLGKYTDEVLMRFVDMLLVIPAFPLLVILSAYLPPTTNNDVAVPITNHEKTSCPR